MWPSSGPIWTDKTNFNKADFEQYLFNENAISINCQKLPNRKDGFPRYFPQMLAFSGKNEDDLLAIWSQTTV